MANRPFPALPNKFGVNYNFPLAAKALDGPPPWCDAWACCRVPLPRPLRPTTGVAVETRLKRLAGLSRPSRPWLRRLVRQPLSRVRQARTYPAARPDPAAPRALRQPPARPDPRSAGPTGISAASRIASSRAAPPDGARVPMAPSQAREVSCASRSGAPVEGVQDSDGGRSVRQYPGHCGPPRPQWAVLRQPARGRCPRLTSRHRWQHIFKTPAAPAAPPIPRRRLRAAAPRAVQARRASPPLPVRPARARSDRQDGRTMIRRRWPRGWDAGAATGNTCVGG